MENKPHLVRNEGKKMKSMQEIKDTATKKSVAKPGLHILVRISYAMLCPLCTRNKNNKKKGANIGMYFMVQFVVVVRNE